MMENEDTKTFLTALLLLKNIFTEERSKKQLLSDCIDHRLNRNMEDYERRLKRSIEILANRDNPMSLLKKLLK